MMMFASAPVPSGTVRLAPARNQRKAWNRAGNRAPGGMRSFHAPVMKGSLAAKARLRVKPGPYSLAGNLLDFSECFQVEFQRARMPLR